MNLDYQKAAQALVEELVDTRRDFHRHPELGYQEVRTAGIVAQRLSALGFEVQTGVGRTGVVGMLEGVHPGPVVMVRFDMDALPIHEANTTSYVSQSPGVMHACGHDGHVSIGLSLARLLAGQRERLAGTVKFVFQPAEEGQNGAAAMIRDGVLSNPQPDVALGLHLWNFLPVGQAGVTAGPSMAAADILRVTVQGKGGHGAIPHEAIDPVVAAAQIITALQSVVSRNVAPLDSAVVTIATVHAGTAFNIIPETVEMTGTIRSLSPMVRERVVARVRNLIEGVAEGMGVEATTQIEACSGAVVNDEGVSEVVRRAAAAQLGALNVFPVRTLAAEDMSAFLNEVPGCFFFVGSANAQKSLDFPHHHDRFDFDERALPVGLAIMTQAVAHYVLDEA